MDEVYSDEVLKIAKETGIKLCKGYIPAPYHCYKCERSILVFTWFGHEIWGEKPIKVPHPRSLEFRLSKTVGESYWVNTCVFCHAIQGDWFLYSQPDGPFWHLGNYTNKVSGNSLIDDLLPGG